MYEYYESKAKFGRKAFLLRLSLALVFLATLGFAGGVLYLLFFLVPFEQWLVDSGVSQGTIDVALDVLIVGWVLFGFLLTLLYTRLFLRRGGSLLAGAGVAVASVAAAVGVFFLMLDNDLLAAAGQLGQQSADEGQRLVFGPYPDADKLAELEDEGYDGVIALLSPKVPFERVLLEQEEDNGKEAGIRVYSRPMLPWITGNEASLEAIKALAAQEDKQFYIHCYLGKHRVDIVRQELEAEAPDPTEREVDLPYRFERGQVETYEGERIILGPYPTQEEWFEYVLRRDVDEIVSTLDPDNPDDAPWIEEERKIAEENGLKFTLMPLDPLSPDPAAVQKVVRHVKDAEGKVYVHDFLDAKRFEAIERGLDEGTPEGADQAGGEGRARRGPSPG
jgi:protein tyrosine phosphatase (PTP) superfamily phosphohydrolase (DUF442 family)